MKRSVSKYLYYIHVDHTFSHFISCTYNSIDRFSNYYIHGTKKRKRKHTTSANPMETIESEIKKERKKHIRGTNIKRNKSGGFIQKSIGLVQPVHI